MRKAGSSVPPNNILQPLFPCIFAHINEMPGYIFHMFVFILIIPNMS